jgi:hypothetical protein
MHWSSRASVESLFRVTEQNLLERFDDCKPSQPVRRDSMLAALLKGKETNDENVVDLLTQLCPRSEFLPNISKLTAAFDASEDDPGTGWYRGDTCYEVHKLIISSLIAYANALRIVQKVNTQLEDKREAAIIKRPERQSKLKDGMEQLFRCSHLLWRITSSNILRHHLKLLKTTHWLYHPTISDAKLPSKVYGELAQYELSEGLVEDEQEQSEEFRSMKDIPNLDKSFLRWMQLQVAHRIGQDILSPVRGASQALLQKVKISIVTVKHPQGQDREMEPWVEMLRKLHFPEKFDMEGAINAIKKAISDDKYTDSIFKKFRKSPNFNLTEFPGNLHCEVLLGLLMKYYQDYVGQDSTTLRLLAQVCFHFVAILFII